MTSVEVVRWGVLVAWALWVVTYWRVGFWAARGVRRSVGSDHAGLDRLLMIGVPLVTAALLAEMVRSAMQAAPPPTSGTLVSTVLGAGLAVAGMAGTFVCRYHLGRYWAVETTLQSEHAVVDSGPYGLVRHPIFTSAILIYVGSGLVGGTTPAQILALLAAAAYVAKARYEDSFLTRNLPGYPGYRERVRYRLVPSVW